MSNNRKKAIVRMLPHSAPALAGYLPLAGIVQGEAVELLDLAGRVVPIPIATVKMICYVNDFNLNDPSNPERITRKTFLARPRTEGLWVRIAFTDGDVLEALAPIDRTLLDALLTDRGLYLIPPDIRGNTQRLFVPHAAIAGIQLLAVITNPSRIKAAKPEAAQTDLFPAED
jgi:hypothetical protein